MEKKLYRVDEGAILLGVCGGIGEYLGVDPNVVRVITLILACAGFVGVVAYVIAAFILPRKSEIM